MHEDNPIEHLRTRGEAGVRKVGVVAVVAVTDSSKAPIVAPGRYTAQLGVLENGAVTPLAEPRTVTVVRLDVERGMH